MSEVKSEKDYTHNIRNAQPKCPKNLKVHKSIKGQAALMKGTAEEKRRFMRTMALAVHDAATKYRPKTVLRSGGDE